MNHLYYLIVGLKLESTVVSPAQVQERKVLLSQETALKVQAGVLPILKRKVSTYWQGRRRWMFSINPGLGRRVRHGPAQSNCPEGSRSRFAVPIMSSQLPDAIYQSQPRLPAEMFLHNRCVLQRGAV